MTLTAVPRTTLEGKVPPGKRVVVYDSDGYFMGPDLADRMQKHAEKFGAEGVASTA